MEMLACKQSAVPCWEKVAVVMKCGGGEQIKNELKAVCEAVGVISLEEFFCW